MAFVDEINDYTTGETGTLTDADGNTVDYTITDGATNLNIANHGDNSARIDGQGSEILTVTFDEPTQGISVTFQGSDDTEFYAI